MFGRNGEGSDDAVIVEPEQWEKCSPALGERLVTTWVGGAEREVLRPSVEDLSAFLVFSRPCSLPSRAA